MFLILYTYIKGKSFHETAKCTLVDRVVVLHERHPEVIDNCSQLVGAREGGSFSRAAIEIAAIIKQTAILTFFSFAFFVVIATFVRNFSLPCPKSVTTVRKFFVRKFLALM